MIHYHYIDHDRSIWTCLVGQLDGMKPPPVPIVKERTSHNVEGEFTVECVVCGITFQSVHSKAKTCDEHCRLALRRMNERLRNTGNQNAVRMSKCEICGSSYAQRSPHIKTCSKECSKKLKVKRSIVYYAQRGSNYLSVAKQREMRAAELKAR